jgi:hypothetical protein
LNFITKNNKILILSSVLKYILIFS